MLITTKNLIKKHDPGQTGWKTLCDALGPDYGDDTPIPIARIVKTNGLNDALWALRAVPFEQEAERDRIARLFACVASSDASRFAASVAKLAAEWAAGSGVDSVAASVAVWFAERDRQKRKFLEMLEEK